MALVIMESFGGALSQSIAERSGPRILFANFLSVLENECKKLRRVQDLQRWVAYGL